MIDVRSVGSCLPARAPIAARCPSWEIGSVYEVRLELQQDATSSRRTKGVAADANKCRSELCGNRVRSPRKHRQTVTFTG